MLKVIFSFQRPHLFIKRKNHTIRSRGFFRFYFGSVFIYNRSNEIS